MVETGTRNKRLGSTEKGAHGADVVPQQERLSVERNWSEERRLTVALLRPGFREASTERIEAIILIIVAHHRHRLCLLR